jgi:23S rRNA (adenine2503-C2)-methyltransferase
VETGEGASVKNFFDLTLSQVEGAIGAMGNEKFRARQLYQWIYGRGVLDFSAMTDISKGLRILLKEMFSLELPAVVEVLTSSDGCKKFAFAGGDGGIFEGVLIPEKDRNTLCISTQIGCRMGCRFCVTGKIGFVRNLAVSEIVGQVVRAREHLGEQRITNIVLMGMGEPLDNRDNLFPALEILKNPLGLDFSHRRTTLSTVGLLDGLYALEPRAAGLAISLNAADDEKRSFLMPINRLYSIGAIVDFVKSFPSAKRTRITFEYVLIKDVNDSIDDAKALARLLKGVKCKINLIPYNESPYCEFKTPDEETVERFHQYLLERHFTAIVRDSRGKDVFGGCGQLGITYLEDREHGCTAGI